MKKKIIILITCFFLIILLGAIVFSYLKFEVINPFSSCIGMLKVLKGDENYIIVQKWPKKVAFGKIIDNSDKLGKEYLDEYMSSRGFKEIENEQMGSQLCYSNGNEKEYINYSTNMYYSKWVWDRNEMIEKGDTNIVSVINNVNLTDIPYEFPIEEAVKQGCFVINEDKIYNKKILDNFIKNTEINAKERIPDKIRIVVYNVESEPTIYDLEYKILDEKYINEEGKEINKTSYILIKDPSRIQSSEVPISYQEVEEAHKIKIKDNIPGEFYGITIKEDKEINAASISLSLYAVIDYVSPEIKQYENIEITRYLLDSEIAE